MFNNNPFDDDIEDSDQSASSQQSLNQNQLTPNRFVIPESPILDEPEDELYKELLEGLDPIEDSPSPIPAQPPIRPSPLSIDNEPRQSNNIAGSPMSIFSQEFHSATVDQTSQGNSSFRQER